MFEFRMRLSSFVLCAAVGAAALFARPARASEDDPAKISKEKAGAKTAAEQSSATQPSEGKTAEKSEPAEESFIRRAEKSVDKAAGKAVQVIGAVFFYDLGGRSQEFAADGKVIDLEGVRKLVQQAEDAGFNLKEVDYTLSIPALTRDELKLPQGQKDDLVKKRKKEAKRLQKQFNKEFTAGRTRSFTIAVRDPGKDDKGNTTLTVKRQGIPVVVLWLVIGAVIFTLRMGFINFRGFKHAVKVTAGKYDNPADTGEVNHFQALTAALSATVGLGNIAGVAIAVMAGGPGATFWMIIAGLLGMSSKFTECTLGQKFREVRSDGRIMGGAMFYLSKGLGELKLVTLGKTLGVLFAVLCIFASFGGGNAFQVNQSGNAIRAQLQEKENKQLLQLNRRIEAADDKDDQATVDRLTEEKAALEADMQLTATRFNWIYGLIMAVMVGVVIIGGIRRIAATAEKIVPLMCGIYVLACLWILLVNATAIPDAFMLIGREAFTPEAGFGGFLGVLVMGFRRAAFSNEAGVGSAAIAHSAAKTDYPVREGIVALLEPFIDTVVICTMTALVIVITGAYQNPDYAHYVASNNGAALTSDAMEEQISWFPWVLSVAVMLFAYSTMISWSYYGERCWAYLFGDRASMAYRIIFLVFVVLGAVMSATNVLDLSDLAILGMAFPNILGVLLLSGMVKRDLDDYWKKLKAGDFDKPAE
jgi:alanine or glycine:cation symporter, AGCS family